MSRLYLRLALIPVVLFSLTLMLVRAQPDGDRSLRQLFTSEGCPAPCFMGIHPGMTVPEVLRLLRGHEWVESVDNRTIQNTGGYIYWHWKPTAPAWIDTARRGTIWISNRTVDQFWVDTRYALGEWIIQLGQPDINIMDDKIDTGHGIYQYRGVHAAEGLVVTSWQRCTTGDPYHGRVTIKFRSLISEAELSSMMYLDQWAYRFNHCS
ncbi:MAG: hypothetical protein GC179_12540 [Anaerolineaceae bacterium]|nr:hypothetical protein [Anaerolineaceae bacterium]